MLKKDRQSISADSFFIRLKNKPDHFLHSDGIDPNDADFVIYKGKPSIESAEVWTKEKGTKFIAESGNTNLELINVFKVIDNDGSLN